MGKRSGFAPRKADKYYTWDPRAVRALLPHLEPGTLFAEPCAGQGHLVGQLVDAGHVCTHLSDLDDGTDALTLPPLGLVITNPPWSRSLLHPMITHWVHGGAWLLFDSSWAFTKQSSNYMKFVTDIVAVGRLRWIEGTSMDGKDDCSWYQISANKTGPTRFHGRIP